MHSVLNYLSELYNIYYNSVCYDLWGEVVS